MIGCQYTLDHTHARAPECCHAPSSSGRHQAERSQNMRTCPTSKRASQKTHKPTTTTTLPRIITMAVETQTPVTTTATHAAPPSPGTTTPQRRIIDGIDTHTADGAAVFPFATIHANAKQSSTQNNNGRARHVVLQSGIIPATSLDDVRAVFLDIRNIWKWQWDTERIEIVQTGDDDPNNDDKNLPVPLHHEQRAYHYPKQSESAPSDAPIVQKVVAVTCNAVTFCVDGRPPLYNVQVTLSIEPSTEKPQDTKASVVSYP